MVYSIKYQTDGGNFSENAVDWNWRFPREWARSDRDGPGNKWYSTRGLDQHSYQAIMNHFGLINCQSDFPLEKVTTMSWEELGRLRRNLEKDG